MDPEGHYHGLGPTASTYADEEDHARVHDEVLQYAYEHDLIEDYTLNSFSISHLLAPLVQRTLPSITENGFTDDSHLPSLEIFEPSLESNLDIPQSAQKFRDEALRELTDGEVKSLTQGILDAGSTRHLKLELPILGADDECDMKEFHRELATRRDVRIGDHRLPLDLVTGDGMQLPESALLEANELLRKLENEKLVITRSALQFLADVVKDEYDEEEQWSSLVEEVKGTKWERVGNHHHFRSITGPLAHCPLLLMASKTVGSMLHVWLTMSTTEPRFRKAGSANQPAVQPGPVYRSR